LYHNHFREVNPLRLTFPYAFLIHAGRIMLLNAHPSVRRLLGGRSSSSLMVWSLTPIEQLMLMTTSCLWFINFVTI
jgi:hypothetical protein